MTVKDRVGRTRYVAFQVVRGGPVHRAALSGALPAHLKLTRFDGTFGVVRTGHRDRDGAVAALRGVARLGSKEVRVETLVTSGTLRGAARSVPSSSSTSKRSPPPRP